jgi:hypothetical protein
MHAVENVLLLEVIELRAIFRQPRLLQVVPYVRNLQGCWTITTYPRRTWTATVLCTPVDLILWVPVVFTCILQGRKESLAASKRPSKAELDNLGSNELR